MKVGLGFSGVSLSSGEGQKGQVGSCAIARETHKRVKPLKKEIQKPVLAGLQALGQ